MSGANDGGDAARVPRSLTKQSRRGPRSSAIMATGQGHWRLCAKRCPRRHLWARGGSATPPAPPGEIHR
eukprot:9680410-Alexandrium_andersonii.AAC.1